MANKPKREVDREKQLIRKLMDVDNLKDDAIIQQLQINPRTFYRYKKKLQKEDAKFHEQQNKDSVKFREAKFHKTLEDGYLISKRIAEDSKTSARDRLEAIKVMATCQAQMSKLARYGAVFKPELPGEVLELEQRESNI